ncbi:MAG: M20/M25/M40 family metallo-hydrolase, partial [Anaerolineae bacterium]|nr:M20/M25/M40 family metallo-hydrolase [Anaerolineae bacterium]
MMSDLLIELVRHYSPSRSESAAVFYLGEWLNAHGLTAHVDAAGNVCGRRGLADAPHTLLMLGHIDTVPGEIPVRVEDRADGPILYGRGSVDAKGSLCAFAEAAAQATIPDGWRVIVIGAVEEEIETSKGAHYIRDQFSGEAAPDLCIIGEPSGANRITLGYKGHLMIDYALSRPAAHTSRPEPSVGALGAAFWQNVLDWCADRNADQNAKTVRDFDQVFPQLRAINTESDGFTDTVRLTIGFRLPPGLTPEDMTAAA